MDRHVPSPRLTCLVRDLQAAHSPSLDTIRARSAPATLATDGFASRLCALFGLDALAPPVARLTHLADGGAPGNGCWLRLDPVHLLVAGDRLILTDPNELRLTQIEADHLVAPVQQLFASDGWRIEALHPNRWYLHLRQRPAIETASLPAVLGRDIHPFLPKGPEARVWRRYLNEVEMLLGSSEVNTEREARGEPVVNSVWLWGEGELPAPPARRFARVWGDDSLARGLALFTQTPVSRLPDDAGTWLEQAEGGEHLLVLGADALGCFDHDWLAPILKFLRDASIERFTLHGSTGLGFMLDTQMLRPWWRAGLHWLARSRFHRLT